MEDGAVCYEYLVREETRLAVMMPDGTVHVVDPDEQVLRPVPEDLGGWTSAKWVAVGPYANECLAKKGEVGPDWTRKLANAAGVPLDPSVR